MARNEERSEPIEIDINSPDLIEGDAVEFDLNEDFQARSAPPPKAKYRAKIFIEDDKVEATLKKGFKKDDPNGYFYTKSLTCKIQDPSGKWQDSVFFHKVSSFIARGKKTSSMMGMLQFLKVKIKDPRMSELALTKLFMRALKQLDGPILIGDCDWSAWDSNNTKRNDFGATAVLAETGKAAVTMLNFPKKADGTYNHIAHTKEGVEVIAKLKLIRWIDPRTVKAEDSAVSKPGGATKLNAPVVAKPVAKKVEEVVEVDPIQQEGLEFGEDGEVVLEG